MKVRSSRPKKPHSPGSFSFMNVEQLATEMNLSVSAIRALQRWNAPFIAKKSHPELLFEWIKRNPDKLQKIE